MNTWFRLYNEAVFDPKVQQLSPKIFKIWINFLCLASRNDGVIPSLSDLMFILRLTESKTHAAIGALYDAGLIDKTDKGLVPHNWDGRQFKSDGSTERVQRFRERKGNVSETLHETVSKQDQTRADTEQIQNRAEKEPLAISSPPVRYSEDFQKFWSQSTRRGSKVEAMKAWKVIRANEEMVEQIIAGMTNWKNSEQWQDETKQTHICRWLKRRGWEEEVPKSHNGNGNGKPHYTPEELAEATRKLKEQGAIK